MMKQLFFTMALLLTAATASAQYTKSVRLTSNDGTNVILNLSQQLAIRFDNSQLVASDGERSITISLGKDISMEYLTETATTIESPKEADYTADGNSLVFQSLKAGQAVRIYSIDGKQIAAFPPADGSVRIDLTQLPRGINIIKAGKYTLKYISK